MDNLPCIMPLFWLRGEPLEVIETEIREMHRAGLRGFIVEARPFPDYMGDFWWETLDMVMRIRKHGGK